MQPLHLPSRVRRWAFVACCALAASGCGGPSYEGGYDQGKPNGEWVHYFPTGQRAKAGKYVGGVPDGLWTFWYPGGQKQQEGPFADGAPEGEWTYWYENGQKLKKGKYRRGKEDGDWIFWHQAGQRSGEGRFHEGERIGVWKHWDEHGGQWLTLHATTLSPEWDERKKKLTAAAVGRNPSKDAPPLIAEAAAQGAEALPLASMLLRDRDPRLRTAGAELSAKLGPAAGPAAELLADLLRDSNPAVVEQARAALVALGSEGVWALRKTMQASEPALRLEAVRIAAAVGPPAKGTRAELVQMLRDPQPEVARSAAKALGSLGDESLDMLVKALGDARLEVRAGALLGLGMLKGNPEKTVPLLVEALGDRQPALVAAAEEGLGSAGAPAVEPLVALFAKKNDELLKHVCQALGKVGAPAVPRLVECLSDARPEFRMYAATALGHMREAAAPALPKLKSMANPNHEIDDNVRFYVNDALKKIPAGG